MEENKHKDKPMKPTRIIEICANSAQSCVEAEAGGAKRVELCAGIPEGGTTPSYGEIKTAQALTSTIDINVIIRPRGGDFLYTPAEIDAMLLDIELCKQLKVHGVVFGCLTKEGDMDVPLMRRLMEAAKPDAMVQHCLPAHREEEITAAVFEAHAEEIFQEAENRLHVQKAVMALLMGA